LGGDGSDEGAIGKAASADLNGFEQARESATGADGVDERAFAKDDRIAGSEIRRDDGERNLHVLELLGFEDAFHKVAEAMIAGESETGNAPPGNIAKTDGAAGGEDASERCAAGVGSSKDAANAGTSDVRDWDVILLEDL
jgi:hypothetical protein